MNKADRDKLRGLMVRKLLWELVVAAKAQVDPVTWRAQGGPETEDFLDALENGRPHSLLRQWEEFKKTVAANRPAPDLLDQNSRHLIVALCEALHRAGRGKGDARKYAVEILAKTFPDLTPKAIEHWQADYPLTPESEFLISRAIVRHGTDHARIAGWFVGLIRFGIDPLIARNTVTREPPPLKG